VSQQLTYGHYIELLPYEDINKVKYYIKLVEDNNLSIRELRARIKSNDYERLPDTVKNKLVIHEEPSVIDLVKNP
jgi:predicted nuclease of restriction endonuclease-like (RecB) superfamily